MRSPQLLTASTSGLIVIDLQEKLLPKISGHQQVVWNATRLIRAAGIMQVPMCCSEQYPQGLGASTDRIAELVDVRHAKRDFSVAELDSQIGNFSEQNRNQLVLCGIETHVCVLQSALDLVSQGFDIFVVGDAVNSRGADDHSLALNRMRDLGVSVVTTESVLFEWCASSKSPHFKAISQLIQESPLDRTPGIGFQTPKP